MSLGSVMRIPVGWWDFSRHRGQLPPQAQRDRTGTEGN
jgi:hypothetical protein